MRKAQCSCGGLSVETTNEPKLVLVCHCTECQRRTGAPFSVSAYFHENDVSATGDASTYERSSDAGRMITANFCPTCGTTVHWRAEFVPELIGVAVGCFTDPDFPAPQRVVHTRRKHAWVVLPDDVPAFDQQTV